LCQVPPEIPPAENDSAATPQAGLSVAASEASRAPTQEPEDKAHVGQDQAPVDWFDLHMLAKLDSLHLLAEWQFQNPTRLRTLMRNDDELATWVVLVAIASLHGLTRAYSATNLSVTTAKRTPFGLSVVCPHVPVAIHGPLFTDIPGDRLWIQRVFPKPQNPRKRKRPAENQKTIQAAQKTKPSKRPRTRTTATKADIPPSRVGSGRAAKIQAKIKLDAQVKELAEFTRQLNGRRSTARLSKRSDSPPRTLGTRVSARLRGPQASEWQAVPDDWMDEPLNIERGATLNKTDNENSSRGDMQQSFGDGSDSELTELSDDSDKQDTSDSNDNEQADADAVEDASPPVKEEEPENQVDDQFIEWETVPFFFLTSSSRSLRTD
jgi:hypothetical protein